MARLQPIDLHSLNGQQSALADRIAEGPRGGVRGPLLYYMYSPGLAEPAAELGEHVRYGSVFDPELSELAILMAARSQRCDYAWIVHEEHALAAGVTAETMRAILSGDEPRLPSREGRAFFKFADELLKNHRVSDATYGEALELFGPTGLVDLVGILGYYTLVAMTLNAHQPHLPDDALPVDWPVDGDHRPPCHRW